MAAALQACLTIAYVSMQGSMSEIEKKVRKKDLSVALADYAKAKLEIATREPGATSERFGYMAWASPRS